MEKKITVHVVKQGEVEVAFPSAKKAQEAVQLLSKFGIEAESEKTTRTVTI